MCVCVCVREREREREREQRDVWLAIYKPWYGGRGGGEMDRLGMVTVEEEKAERA